MSTRLPALLMAAIAFALAPAVALAAECSDVPLTAEQQAYLDSQGVEIVAPIGDVPDIQRCDIDQNNVVDMHDIRAIAGARNQPAAHPDDPMDWDRNSIINVSDARGCQRACTLPRCATPSTEPEALVGGETEEAQCHQSEDINGDGKSDVVAMSQYTGALPRGGDFSLEVVILAEDENGNTQHVTFPYTGKQSLETGEIEQHLSTQPAGEVNLNPGLVVIDQPAVVSYRDGEPNVIYYFVDGVLTRAFYGIDD
jgi:hypothetical protein